MFGSCERREDEGGAAAPGPPPGHGRPHPPFFGCSVQKCKETLRTQMSVALENSPGQWGDNSGNAVAQAWLRATCCAKGGVRTGCGWARPPGRSKELKGPPGSFCGEGEAWGRPWPDGTWLTSLDSRERQGRQKGHTLGLLLAVARGPQGRPARGAPSSPTGARTQCRQHPSSREHRRCLQTDHS